MPVLLDIAPEKVATYVAAGAGAIAGIAKALSALRDLRKRREYAREAEQAEQDAAARAAGPFGAPADPAQANLEMRLRIAELDADKSRLAWKLEEARRQRMVLVREVERLQGALTGERRTREMVEITCNHLRERVRQLEGRPIEVVELEVVADDETTTTPLRPKPMGA